MQLDFIDLHIQYTISKDDSVKEIFDTIDWKSLSKLMPKSKGKVESLTIGYPCCGLWCLFRWEKLLCYAI